MNNIYADFISPQVSRLSYSDEIIENTTTSLNYHVFLTFFFFVVVVVKLLTRTVSYSFKTIAYIVL